MYTKAQPRAGHTAFQIPALCDVARITKSEVKSCELVVANLKVLQKMDAFVFFEAAPDAMILLDQHGRIGQANSQTERMFGYGREELVGEPIEILMPERFRTGPMQHRSQYASAPGWSYGSRAGTVGPSQGWQRIPDRGELKSTRNRCRNVSVGRNS